MKQFILHQLNNLGISRKKTEIKNILDKRYRVIQGTIRNKPDQDDAWLFALSSNNKNIYDIGSNIGQAAMIMLYHKDVENIVLVDPNPLALSKAAENLIVNSLSHKAKFINAFISDHSDNELNFYTTGSGAAGSKFKSFAKTAKKLNSHFKVKTKSIDSLLKLTGIVPDLVKIDVEGAEIDALNGASGLAKESKTIFFVEIHSGMELSITDNTKLILEWCNNNNYTAWYLKKKIPLDINLIKKRGRYHTLLLPNKMKFPSYLKDIKPYDVIKKHY